MAMILDTDLIPPKDRADAVGQAMQLSGIPARITHEPPPEHIFVRADRTGGFSQLPGILLTNQAAPYEFNRIGGGQTYAVASNTPRSACRSTGCRLPQSGSSPARSARPQPRPFNSPRISCQYRQALRGESSETR